LVFGPLTATSLTGEHEHLVSARHGLDLCSHLDRGQLGAHLGHLQVLRVGAAVLHPLVAESSTASNERLVLHLGGQRGERLLAHEGVEGASLGDGEVEGVAGGEYCELRQVELGDVDSGGGGYRLDRVPQISETGSREEKSSRCTMMDKIVLTRYIFVHEHERNK